MHPSQALLGFARVFQVSEYLILHKYRMPWEPDAGSEEYANTRHQEPAECNYSLYGAP
jgi:hypothetical protein